MTESYYQDGIRLPMKDDLVAFGKWIKCSDRLPTDDGKYLSITQKTIVICTFYKGFFYKSRAPKRYYESWLTENKKYKHVTHWMKLPESPNE